MEFFHELFFTAVIAVLFSFLIAKLVSMAMSGDSTRDSQSASVDNVDRIGSSDSGEAVIMEELQFHEKLQVEEHGSEKVTEVVEEVTEIVEEFLGDAMVETASCELPTEPAEQVEVIATSRSLSAKESVEGGEVIENAPPMLSEKASIEEIKDIVNVRSESSAKGLIEEVEEDKGVEVGEKIDVEKCEDVAAGKVEEGKDVVEIDVEDDDWEGIERSEVEKVFAEAVKFVERGAEKNERFGSEAEMELYGLHKVATEGPCHEQPPMALKLAARAKWY